MAVARARPDVVVLDLNMPGPDGCEVRRPLARDPSTAAVPVIVLTALEPEAVDRTRLTGVHAVLNKSRLTASALAATLAPLCPSATYQTSPDQSKPSTAEEHP